MFFISLCLIWCEFFIISLCVDLFYPLVLHEKLMSDLTPLKPTPFWVFSCVNWSILVVPISSRGNRIAFEGWRDSGKKENADFFLEYTWKKCLFWDKNVYKIYLWHSWWRYIFVLRNNCLVHVIWTMLTVSSLLVCLHCKSNPPKLDIFIHV